MSVTYLMITSCSGEVVHGALHVTAVQRTGMFNVCDVMKMCATDHVIDCFDYSSQSLLILCVKKNKKMSDITGDADHCTSISSYCS